MAWLMKGSKGPLLLILGFSSFYKQRVLVALEV
jgi:hypothetical protein